MYISMKNETDFDFIRAFQCKFVFEIHITRLLFILTVALWHKHVEIYENFQKNIIKSENLP